MKRSSAMLVAAFMGALLAFALAGCTSDSSASASQTSSSASASASTETSAPAKAKGAMTLRFLDVGQGDATLIESQGHWLLIDGGPADASDKMYAVLKQLGVANLDAIIATHPDADHIGGIAGALNGASTGALYCSTTSGPTKTFESMVKYLPNGVSVTVPKLGESFSLGDATVTFVGPSKDFGSENDNSLVVRVECGGSSVLFAGDAGEAAEQDMLSRGASVRADVLHVSHHGSADATSAAFLKKVSPRFGVVSVGVNNDYGHPTEKTLEAIHGVGAQILRTDQLGDITLTCENGEISVATQKMSSESPLAPGLILPDPTQESANDSTDTAQVHQYMLNTHSMKFHYVTCSSVGKMSEKNKKLVEMTRDEVRAMGYDPCGNCKP